MDSRTTTQAAGGTAKQMSASDQQTAETKEIQDLNDLLQAELEGLPDVNAEQRSGESHASCETEKLTFAILETAKKLHVANREKERIVHAKYAEILEAGKRAKKMSETLIKKSSDEAERIKAAALESTNRLLSESKRDAALTKQKAHQLAAEVKKKAEEEVQKLKNDAEMASKEIAMAAEKQSTDIVAGAEASALKIIEAATEEKARIQREKADWEKEKLSVKQSHKFDSMKILLDVGGSRFSTRISTLTSGAADGSMLSAMFSGRHALEQDEKDGSYFIDRDGTCFGPVLNYLRDPSDFEDPKSDDARRALEKEAQYYQIESLQTALRYLPVAVFEVQTGHGAGGGMAQQGNDILSHLSRRQSGGVVARSVSSADQISQGSMEEVLSSMVQTYSKTKSIKGQQLNTARLNAAFFNCSQGSAQQRSNAPPGGYTAHNNSSKSRTLVMIDFGDNLVSISSLNVQLNVQYGGEAPRLNCVLALVPDYGATPNILSQSDLSPHHAQLEYCIECPAASEIIWASKVFIMLEVLDRAANGAMQGAYQGFHGYNDFNGQSNPLVQLGGIKMYGSLRQLRASQ